MISVPVFSANGEKLAAVEIDPAEFGGEVNRQLLHDAVVMYQANQRRGTHKTKTRSEVEGSKKKLFRQKGTGHARAGARRTHKRRGGGVAFGPVVRDYSYSMPKQARRLATKMALLSKFQDAEAVVVDGLSLSGPKTKEVAAVLKRIGLVGESCLISTADLDRNIYLSARNIPRVATLATKDLNAYELLRHKRLLLTRESLDALRKMAREGAEGEIGEKS